VPGRSDDNGGERICVYGYPAFLFSERHHWTVSGERMKRVWNLIFL